MGRHRRPDGEKPSPFIMASVHDEESIVRHGMDDQDDVKIVENSYSVWREPVAE